MTWPWVWFTAYTIAVAVTAGSFGALVMAVLVGGKRADDWDEMRARERQAAVLRGIGRRP